MNFKRNTLIVILMFCLTNVIAAQDYAEMYKSIIEFEFSENFTKETFNSSIDANAKISPELIYFNINYLNNTVGQSNNKPETNGRNLMLQEKNNAKQRLYSWYKELYSDYEKMDDSNFKITVKNALNRFNKRVEAPVREFRIEDNSVDNNKVDYTVWKYITKNNNAYDSDVKYMPLREAAEKEQKAKVLNYTNSSYSNTIALMEDLSKVFNEAYLLYKDVTLNNLLAKIEVTERLNDVSKPRYTIYAGYLSTISDYNETFTIANSNRDYEFNCVSEFTGFSIGVEYLLNFFSKDGLVPDLRLGLEYKNMSGEDQKLGYGIDIYTNYPKLINKRADIVNINANLPIHLFEGDVVLDFGAAFLYSNYSFTYYSQNTDVDFNDTQYSFDASVMLHLHYLRPVSIIFKASSQNLFAGVGYELD